MDIKVAYNEHFIIIDHNKRNKFRKLLNKNSVRLRKPKDSKEEKVLRETGEHL